MRLCNDPKLEWCNPNLDCTLCQSRQRELIRVLARFVYTTYTCPIICPCLLIQLYYIIKRKEKEKENKY